MKTFKKISFLILAVVAMGASSCSGDDGDSEKTVRYKINLSSGITLNSVNYRDADGNFVTVTNPGGSVWQKEVRVALPFNANMDYSITNTSSDTKTFEHMITLGNSGCASGNGFIDGGQTQTVSETTTFN